VRSRIKKPRGRVRVRASSQRRSIIRSQRRWQRWLIELLDLHRYVIDFTSWIHPFNVPCAKVGTFRNKDSTIQQLNEMFEKAKQVGNLTNIKSAKTRAGLKDNYLEAMMERMAASYKGCSGTVQKQAALNRCTASLPPNVLSPVWRLRGNEDIPKKSWRDLTVCCRP
jgi:hypothetical protein